MTVAKNRGRPVTGAMSLHLRLEPDLVDGISKFIHDRDVPPEAPMSRPEAVRTIIRDWLMSQGYVPLPPVREDQN